MVRWLMVATLVAVGCGNATEVDPDSGSGSSEGSTSAGTTTTADGSSTTAATSTSDTTSTSTSSATTTATTETGSTSSSVTATGTTDDATGSTSAGEPVEYRRPITIAQGSVSADLPDFVVLVRAMGVDSLRSEPNGGNVANDNGSDLVFRDGAGTPLAWELVSYRAMAGSLTAWVRVPLVTAADDTVVYLHYGDENAVVTPDNPWSNYLAVYHLEDDLQNNNVSDSGMNGVVGVASDLNAQDAVAGLVGRGFRFEDDNDAVRITSAVLDDTGPMTVLAWARMDAAGSGFPRIYHKGGNNIRRVELYVEDDNANLGEVVWRINEDDNDTTEILVDQPTFAVGTFHHYIGVADNQANEMRLYFDGQLIGSDTWAPPIDNGFTNTYLGNWDDAPNGDRNWNGVIDEVHVYNGAGTDAWAQAKYRTMADPTAFAVLGPEEPVF